MKTRVLPVNDFLNAWKKSGGVLFDARSESEYKKGHIPGARSLPLLNDEQRHQIGIIYKEKGREAAVLKGFELVGPHFHEIISKATQEAANMPVFVYCWRGGMRSNITAWLLSMAGLQVCLLEKGYKTFRHFVLAEFEKPRSILVIGGKTGSGKTELIHHLANERFSYIDLEGLANHKGSSYGALGLPPQPSQEHFENLLGLQLSELPAGNTLYLENESRQIGTVNIPTGLFLQLRAAHVVEIVVPYEIRKKRILHEYGSFPVDVLSERTERIGKRLGNNHLKDALAALANGDYSTWLDIILVYYDKAYTHGIKTRNEDTITYIETDMVDLKSLADQIHERSVALLKKSLNS